MATVTSGLEDFESEAGPTELELNVDAMPANASAAELVLQSGPSGRLAAAAPVIGTGDTLRSTHNTFPIVVAVGFLTGFLFTAVLLTGTPEQPSLRSQSSRTEASSPPGSTDDSLPANVADGGSAAAARDAEPSTRASLDREETTAALDLSGEWVVTNRVESTTYRAFENLSIRYQLRLTQDGRHIEGAGQKWVENGRLLPAARRTPIALEGTLSGGRLDLRFIESGARRASGGAFVMHVVDDRTMRGSFTSDAASSRGSSIARRETRRQQ